MPVTFAGEFSIRVGLDSKEWSARRFTFVAAYMNGHISYTPTEEQLRNVGGTPLDSNCLVAPG